MGRARIAGLAAGWLAAALAAGCADRPAQDELFPLASGHRWVYRQTTAYAGEKASEASLTIRTRGADALDGGPAWRRVADSGAQYWLRSDDTGIYRVASRHPLDNGRIVDKERRYVLKRPFTVGSSWEANTAVFVLQRKNEMPRRVSSLYKTLPMKYTIEKVGETVTTEAGRFDGCLVVRGEAAVRVYVDAAFAWRDIPITSQEWYCPSVGLVRLEREEPSPSRFLTGGKTSLDLIDFE